MTTTIIMDSSTTHLYYLILFAELIKEAFVTLKVDSFDSSSSSVAL
jgi:hypothetical protein